MLRESRKLRNGPDYSERFGKMIQNFIAIHKIILSNIFVLWTVGCILQKSSIPIDVNIPKNQMIYQDQKMGIWAFDLEGQ